MVSVVMLSRFEAQSDMLSGDILYLRLLDMDVVVLNSPLVATELLEKRSQMYSDRPYMATVKP